MIKSGSYKAKAGILVWHDQFKTSVLAEEERAGANRANGERKEILCSLRSLLFKSGSGGVVELDFDKSISDGVNMNPESFRGYAKRDGDADFVFLACRAGVRRRRAPLSGLSTMSSQPSTIQRLREYKAVYVLSDAEIGLF